MGLLTCPACGSQISEYAKSCPKCGAAIDKPLTMTNGSISPVISDSNISKEKVRRKRVLVWTAIVIVFVLVATGVAIFALRGQNSIVGTWENDTLLDTFVLGYVYTDDGEFHSYARESSSNINIPMGNGTYSVENGIITTYMDTGSTTESEYEIEGNTLTLDEFISFERID